MSVPLTSGGGFAGVDVSDDNDVDVNLLFFTVEQESRSAMSSLMRYQDAIVEGTMGKGNDSHPLCV